MLHLETTPRVVLALGDFKLVHTGRWLKVLGNGQTVLAATPSLFPASDFLVAAGLDPAATYPSRQGADEALTRIHPDSRGVVPEFAVA